MKIAVCKHKLKCAKSTGCDEYLSSLLFIAIFGTVRSVFQVYLPVLTIAYKEGKIFQVLR